MTRQSDDFLKKLLVTFLIEADEHLKMMSAGLIELENNPAEVRYAEIVESVFREAHSLKGAARAVNMREIESVCQSLESVFAALKVKQLAVSPPLFDLMQEAIDDLSKLLSAEGAAMADAEKSAIATLIWRLSDALRGKFAQSAASQFSAAAAVQPLPPVQHTPVSLIMPLAPVPIETSAPIAAAPSPSPSLASGTVRVSTQKLDAAMRQVEELLSPQLASAQRARELREVTVSFATWKKQRARMRPVLRQIERYVEKGDRDNGAAGRLPELPTKELPKLLEHLESEHPHTDHRLHGQCTQWRGRTLPSRGYGRLPEQAGATGQPESDAGKMVANCGLAVSRNNINRNCSTRIRGYGNGRPG